jgi:hypothetical protein
MLLSHAVLLAEARSYLAALADHATSFDALMEYERVLLQLDALHGGAVPPITVVPATDPAVLYEVARAAISNLADHGVDRLALEICLAMLEAARELDARP